MNCEKGEVGRSGRKYATPVKRMGATSPAPRATARIAPVRMPDSAPGRTTRASVWLLVAPSARLAPPDSRLATLVRVAVTNLAGVPSIVFGLFGLGFFIQFVGRGLDRAFSEAGDLHYGQPALVWAALTLAVLTLPVVIVATEEALRAVPREHRDASLALGATRSQTLARVVLPGALSGILTGAILAVARGAGEVAPILFTGVAYFLPDLPTSPFSQFMHLGYHTYVLATQSPDVEATRPLLYGTVLVLLVLTFALNLVAITIRTRTRHRAAAAH